MILDQVMDNPENQSALRSFLLRRLAANLSYFLQLRNRGRLERLGRAHPGLCADINPLTGEFRPVSEQCLWGCGDGRAVAIWSGIILSGVLSPAHD